MLLAATGLAAGGMGSKMTKLSCPPGNALTPCGAHSLSVAMWPKQLHCWQPRGLCHWSSREQAKLSQVGTGNQVLGDQDKEMKQTHRVYSIKKESGFIK